MSPQDNLGPKLETGKVLDATANIITDNDHSLKETVKFNQVYLKKFQDEIKGLNDEKLKLILETLGVKDINGRIGELKQDDNLKHVMRFWYEIEQTAGHTGDAHLGIDLKNYPVLFKAYLEVKQTNFSTIEAKLKNSDGTTQAITCLLSGAWVDFHDQNQKEENVERFRDSCETKLILACSIEYLSQETKQKFKKAKEVLSRIEYKEGEDFKYLIPGDDNEKVKFITAVNLASLAQTLSNLKENEVFNLSLPNAFLPTENREDYKAELTKEAIELAKELKKNIIIDGKLYKKDKEEEVELKDFEKRLKKTEDFKKNQKILDQHKLKVIYSSNPAEYPMNFDGCIPTHGHFPHLCRTLEETMRGFWAKVTGNKLATLSVNGVEPVKIEYTLGEKRVFGCVPKQGNAFFVDRYVLSAITAGYRLARNIVAAVAATTPATVVAAAAPAAPGGPNATVPDGFDTGAVTLPITPAYSAVASSNAVLPASAPDGPEPGVYWAITRGAFDIYIVDKKEDEKVKLSMIKQSNGTLKEIESPEEKQNFFTAFNIEGGYLDDKDSSKQIVSIKLTEDITKKEEIILAIKCFLGHRGRTCGFSTFAGALASFGKTKEKNNEFVTIEIDGFEGEIELKKLTGTGDKTTDFENRKKLAQWLESNAKKLKNFTNLNAIIKEIIKEGRNEEPKDLQDNILELYKIVKSVSEATQGLTDEAEKQEQEGVNKLKKDLEQQKEQLVTYGITIDPMTINDVAILALLSAFLVVMAGSGALALPAVLAAFRILSLETGWKLDDDGNLNKIDNKLEKPSANPNGLKVNQLDSKAHSVGKDSGVA